SAQTTRTWIQAVSTDWFNPSNWSPAGVPATNDTVNFSAGTINFTAPVIFSGQFNWSGTFSTLSGNALTLTSNGVMTLSGSDTKYLSNVLTNAGTINWKSTGPLQISGMIYNVSGGLFDIQTNGTITTSRLGSELFSNAGTLRKAAAPATNILDIQFANSGTV